MKRKLSPGDWILLAAVLISFLELLFLPQEIAFLPGGGGDALLYFSKYHGILVSFGLTFGGLSLRRTAVHGKTIRRTAGTVLTFGGFLLALLYPVGNPLSLHMEGLGIGILVLWPAAHGIGQFFVCLWTRRLLPKLIPVGLVLLEGLFPLYVYLDTWSQSSGWDALAALIVGIFVLMAAAAVLAAWILYGILLWIRRRKNLSGTD